MYNHTVFPALLGLSSHWSIKDLNFARRNNRLEITVEPSQNANFSCPICKGQVEIVSEKETRWQHDNLFNLRAQITAVLPMTSCERCGINRVHAPWEKPKSRFRILEENDDASGKAAEESDPQA